MSACSHLGSLCGTNIDHDRLDFSESKSNLVYLDKVFSYNKDESCPLLLSLRTCPKDYTVCLKVTDPNGCCCNDCDVDCSSTFTVTNAFVLVEQLLLNGDIDPDQLTVNGIPVDSVSMENGQFVASTANLISQIQRCCCIENGLPTKAFFLASRIGPWAIRFRIILEGIVSTGGKNCRFRAEFVNKRGTFVALPSTSTSNFAIRKLALPCSINHVAPTIRFQFGALAQILNPILTLDLSGEEGACTAVASNLILNGTLVINPTIAVEVIRKSLFCVNGCEALLPCDGTLDSLLDSIEEEEEDCNPFDDDCTCGTRHNRRRRRRGSCDCNSNSCIGGCGNTLSGGTDIRGFDFDLLNGSDFDRCNCENRCNCGNRCGCENRGSCGCGCGCNSCNSCDRDCDRDCDDNGCGRDRDDACGHNSILTLTGTNTCSSCSSL